MQKPHHHHLRGSRRWRARKTAWSCRRRGQRRQGRTLRQRKRLGQGDREGGRARSPAGRARACGERRAGTTRTPSAPRELPDLQRHRLSGPSSSSSAAAATTAAASSPSSPSSSSSPTAAACGLVTRPAERRKPRPWHGPGPGPGRGGSGCAGPGRRRRFTRLFPSGLLTWRPDATTATFRGGGGPDAARRTPPHGAHARLAARAQAEAGPRSTLGNVVAAVAAAPAGV